MDSHAKQCRICQYGPEGIDWGLTNQAISEIADVSKDSVRRHRKWATVNGFDVSQSAAVIDSEGVPEWVEQTGKPRRAWQLASGEWRESYQNVDDSEPAVHIDNDRIDSLIREWPLQKIDMDHSVLYDLANPADLQLGKAGEALGGTEETIQRFQDAIEAVAQRWTLLKPEHGYLNDLGDLIENLFSTTSQVSTNDRGLPEQIEDAVALYMNALGRLLPLVKTLHFSVVTSNHGEARNAMKANPYGSENDWGLHIQRVIQGKCADRGWDVEFHRPDRNEDTTVLTLPDGSKVALNHGHHSGTPTRVKEWVKNQIVGHRPGWDADIWILGHYHHDYHFPVGDGRMVFGTPALDGGSAWFTRKSGEVSAPGIMCLTVSEGDWSNHSILR